MRILVVTGGIGSGKTTVSNGISKLLGWPSISVSGVLSQMFSESGQVSDGKVPARGRLQNFGHQLAKQNPGLLVTRLLDSVPMDATVIIDGIRYQTLIDALSRAVGIDSVLILFLDASSETRLTRAARRDQIAVEELIAVDSHIVEIAARGLAAISDVVVDAEFPLGRVLIESLSAIRRRGW